MRTEMVVLWAAVVGVSCLAVLMARKCITRSDRNQRFVGPLIGYAACVIVGGGLAYVGCKEVFTTSELMTVLTWVAYVSMFAIIGCAAWFSVTAEPGPLFAGVTLFLMSVGAVAWHSDLTLYVT